MCIRDSFITFDLLIIDIMMPGLNGYELTKEIRSSSNVPIIPVSYTHLRAHET